MLKLIWVELEIYYTNMYIIKDYYYMVTSIRVYRNRNLFENKSMNSKKF